MYWKIDIFVFFFFHFSCFSPVSRFVSPLCFPIVVPGVWSRCTTPSWGRSPWANRWKNWWVRTCVRLQKKNLWFSIFSFDFYTDTFLKQWNILNNKYLFIFFSLFIFLSFFGFCFPVVLPCCGPRCMIPLHYPVVGSKSLSQPLKKLMS